MLSLLIDDSNKRAVTSLFSERFLPLPEFAAGEARPIECCPVKRIKIPFDSRLFTPKDPSDWTIQVALGGGFILPVAGTWPITYDTDSSDSVISFNPLASEISDILNALQSVVDAGGVIVNGASGFFTFTFNEVGMRDLLFGDPVLLVPLSLLTFERIVTGDVDTREVQILRIAQNAGSFATLGTDADEAEITIDELQAGGVSANHKIRINLPENRYGGTWTFLRDAVESDQIGWGDNEAEIRWIIESMSNIGAGNVSVRQDDEDSFIAEFIGALANTNITGLSADASSLRTILFKSGVLDLRTPGIESLLNGSTERVVILEVQAADATDYPVKILQRDVMLRRPVLTPETTQPQPSGGGEVYSTAEVDALLEGLTGDFPTLSISTAGTNNLAPTTEFLQWFQLVTAAAGAGAYTHVLPLDNTKAKDGAIFRIEIDFAASANPTIQIRDNTSGGTLLESVSGDAGGATYYVGQFRFNGTNWLKLSGSWQT